MISMFFILISFTNSVSAQTTVTDRGNNSGTTVVDRGNSGNSAESIKLKNPLGTTDNIPDLVRDLLDIVLEIGIPIIALAIIFAGFKFISAQGNPEKLKSAKETLKYVFIGAAILLAAYVIAEAVVNTINAIRG